MGKDYTLPKRTNNEKLKKIIVGCYNADIEDQTKKTTDLAEEIGYEDKFGRINSFLDELGVIRKDGHDIQLTDEGSEIGKLLQLKDEETARQKLRPLLEDHSLTKDITTYISAQESVDKSDLKNQVGDMTGHNRPTTLKSIIDLWEWTEIIEKNDEGFYELAEIEDNETATQESLESVQNEVEHNQPIEKSQTVNSAFNIQVEISGDDDPENVKEILETVQETIGSD